MVRILLGRASSRSQSDSRKNWIKSRERSPALLNLRFAGTFAFASHFCNEPVAAFFRSRRSLPLATFVFLPAHLLKDARSHTAHPQVTHTHTRLTHKLHGTPFFEMIYLILFTA